MTAMKERAIELVKKMPEDKIFFLVNILESMEELISPINNKKMMDSQVAYQELQKYRRPRNDEIDYKESLHSAWEEKYESID